MLQDAVSSCAQLEELKADIDVMLQWAEILKQPTKVAKIASKNWLFHGNDIGAQAGSILFSLIETCKQNQGEVFSWLKYVLTNIHQADTIGKLEKLLPYHIIVDPKARTKFILI